MFILNIMDTSMADKTILQVVNSRQVIILLAAKELNCRKVYCTVIERYKPTVPGHR